MREEYARLSEGHADFRLQHEWVPYDKISNSLKRAVVAAEDSNFTEHDGVEWEAIRKAWEYNQKQEEAGRSKMRGGSTITQQLAKNLFLSSSRSYVRKGQELVLTYMIEHVASKERILELYLNVAEWGVACSAPKRPRSTISTPPPPAWRQPVGPPGRHAPNPRFYDRNRNSNYLNSRVGVLTRRMQMVDIPEQDPPPPRRTRPPLSPKLPAKIFPAPPHAGRPDLLLSRLRAFLRPSFSCVPPVATWPAKSIAPALWSFWPCWAFSRSSRWWTTWTTWARSSR